MVVMDKVRCGSTSERMAWFIENKAALKRLNCMRKSFGLIFRDEPKILDRI